MPMTACQELLSTRRSDITSAAARAETEMLLALTIFCQDLSELEGAGSSQILANRNTTVKDHLARENLTSGKTLPRERPSTTTSEPPGGEKLSSYYNYFSQEILFVSFYTIHYEISSR
jgi:hypothetical protein